MIDLPVSLFCMLFVWFLSKLIGLIVSGTKTNWDS